jgi:hypothetical protein
MLTVYMDPAGSDTNDGATPATAVASLAGAEQVILAAPVDEVEVRIAYAGGTPYVAPQHNWTTFGRRITFLPDDYHYTGGFASIAGRPVFEGAGVDGWWLKPALPVGHPGSDVGLRFYYLTVRGYGSGGLLLHGGYELVDGFRVPRAGGLNGNTVHGCRFERMGSLHADGEFGFAGVDLVNSSNNLVRACWFIDLENTPATASHIHGLYLAHGANGNEVLNNRFEGITGSPLRCRNRSSFNRFDGNTFDRCGGPTDAHYVEWSDWRDTVERECPCDGNEYRNNTQGRTYPGPGNLPTWRLIPANPPGGVHAGEPGCLPLTGPRLRTSGNTYV